MQEGATQKWGGLFAKTLVGAGVVITAWHAWGLVPWRANDVPINLLTSLQVGDVVQVEAWRERGLQEFAASEDECVLVVAFNPECPHCKSAAEQLASQNVTSSRPVWVTREPDPAAVAWYDSTLAGRAIILQDSLLYGGLRVVGVPAAFLVKGAAGVIQSVWFYQGGESSPASKGQC